MIFRKPYAFLIKNFRKIHIVLLILCGFILYKTMQLSGFIKEFITYVSYDPFLEPITNYTSILFYLFAILVVVISAILLLLLRRKKKPWLLYLVPVVTYIFLIFIFMMIQHYFATYEGGSITATARAFRDFLNIGMIPQYVTIFIFSIRVIGLDLKRFSFGNDEEFSQLNQDDREEVELSFELDKTIFKRQFRKLIRVLGYFYEEHKFLINVILGIAALFVLGYSTYYYMLHKTVKENQVLNANGYSIVINESYYTSRDKVGNILEENSSFVVLNLTVKNNGNERKMNMSNFHLVNGTTDTTYSESTYSKYFNDIGKEYDIRDFKAGEKRTFALIFKVDKDLEKNNFVLYYQQYKSYKNIYLRKIKLNLKDVSLITKNPSKNIGEELVVTYPNGNNKNMTFESVMITDKISYNKEVCDEDDNCRISPFDLSLSGNYKILEVKFSSSSFEGEELIDFSTNYGKIKYIDNENITKEIKIEDALENASYLGKYLYIKIPTELEKVKSIELLYTVRNQQYGYKIR